MLTENVIEQQFEEEKNEENEYKLNPNAIRKQMLLNESIQRRNANRRERQSVAGGFQDRMDQAKNLSSQSALYEAKERYNRIYPKAAAQDHILVDGVVVNDEAPLNGLDLNGLYIYISI